MAIMPKLFSKEDNYNPMFLKVSVETGVPYSVLKGFVALESAFDEKAYRYEAHINDASYGLAQVLNRTARGVGFAGDPKELFDPYLSVKYGGLFIRALAKKYTNLLDLIAAYNMGFPRKITATTKLIADIYQYPLEYREKPPSDWVYANEPYVRRVATYIAYYQAKEKNDVAEATRIYDLIKKKALMTPTGWSKPLTGVVVSSPPSQAVCPTCSRPL
jgi:soluble lytic murein transglycosylase-like protein